VVDVDELLDLLAGTVAIASPAGGELPLAAWIATWMARRDPVLDCVVDRFAPGRANLECSVGAARSGDLVLYSHLDTSLSGDPGLDRPVAPRSVGVGRLEHQGDTVVGPGVAVAKGPAAAAAVGFLAAARALGVTGRRPRAQLLMAAGGTHRAAPVGLRLPEGSPSSGAGAGVRRFLTRHRPGAAVVAKAGPAGILYEEPGAAYVTVEISGASGLVMTRHPGLFGGGVPAATGTAILALERWRDGYVGHPVPGASQVGRQAGVGALSAGLPYKPDIIGGLLQIHVYIVLGPGDDPAALPAQIEEVVVGDLRQAGWTALKVRATLVDGIGSARTEPTSALVTLVEEVYRDVLGCAPPAISGWTGSTDGVLLRRAGVDTARVGPAPVARSVGTEALSLAELVAYAQLYAEAIVRFTMSDVEMLTE